MTPATGFGYVSLHQRQCVSRSRDRVCLPHRNQHCSECTECARCSWSPRAAGPTGALWSADASVDLDLHLSEAKPALRMPVALSTGDSSQQDQLHGVGRSSSCGCDAASRRQCLQVDLEQRGQLAMVGLTPQAAVNSMLADSTVARVPVGRSAGRCKQSDL